MSSSSAWILLFPVESNTIKTDIIRNYLLPEFTTFKHCNQNYREVTQGVMTKVLDCGLEVNEFELQSSYCFHFWTNTLLKGMNPRILPPSYEWNSTTIVLLQGWLWYQITHEGWYAIKQRSRIKTKIVYLSVRGILIFGQLYIYIFGKRFSLL